MKYIQIELETGEAISDVYQASEAIINGHDDFISVEGENPMPFRGSVYENGSWTVGTPVALDKFGVREVRDALLAASDWIMIAHAEGATLDANIDIDEWKTFRAALRAITLPADGETLPHSLDTFPIRPEFPAQRGAR